MIQQQPLCIHHFFRDTAKDPAYWSKVCIFNMAKLAKEATTVRRVLEPLFHNFDAENCWSPEKGIAFDVLVYLQSLLAESGNIGHSVLWLSLKNVSPLNFLCN